MLILGVNCPITGLLRGVACCWISLWCDLVSIRHSGKFSWTVLYRCVSAWQGTFQSRLEGSWVRQGTFGQSGDLP